MLEKLEKQNPPELLRVLRLIDSGAYYDELSEADKDAYCRYKGFDRSVKEAVEMELGISPHEQLTRNPTAREQAEIITEVERILFDESADLADHKK